MNKISFNYTLGDALLLPTRTNIPDVENSEQETFLKYIGYYNITNDIVYTGRTLNEDSIVLVKQDNILGSYIFDKFKFDRSIDDIKLTYDTEDLLFQPNEIINQNSINEKIEKLNSNFFDLYNFCFIRNNNLPINYTRYIGVTGINDDYLTSSSIIGSLNLSTSALGLTDVKGFEVIGMNLNRSIGEVSALEFLLIYFTSTTLYFYKADSTGDSPTVTFLLSADKADGDSSQQYVNITDITTNNRDTLFITDSFHNQIYRLYIDPIINESRINSTNLNLLNTAGYKLNTSGHSYLSGSNLLYYYDNEIYTYNKDIKNITVLDDNLSFKRKFTNKLISSSLVSDFAIDSIEDEIYIILEDFSILKIGVKFDGESKVFKPINKFEVGEQPKRILFSTNDSDVYYIITTKNVYKYLKKDTADDLIGIFKWTNEIQIPDIDYEIADAKILLENENYDSLFILEKNITFNGIDKLLKFTEHNDLISCLHSSDFKIFNTTDIFLKSEYFNNISFNKCIKKLISNIDILASFIHSQFTYIYNINKDLEYKSNQLLNSTISIDKSYNFFVGVNERVTPQVFNRCILKVYDYQNSILNILKKKIIALKFPYDEVVDMNE